MRVEAEAALAEVAAAAAAEVPDIPAAAAEDPAGEEEAAELKEGGISWLDL